MGTTQLVLQQPQYVPWYDYFSQPAPGFAYQQLPALPPHLYSYAQRPRPGEPAPYYLSTPYGAPVNITGGFSKTETRGIFVTSLNYKARTKDIEEYFGKAGKIVDCELQKDAKTGKFKGVATVLYAKVEEARRAIELFNGRTWMERNIHVRMDKEATRIARPSRPSTADDSNEAASSQGGGPLIVNGSGGAGRGA